MKNIIAATIGLVLLASTVQASNSRNRVDVFDIGSGTFEVILRRSGGAQAYWCGAGDHAFKLGARSGSRVYLVSGPQPSVAQPGKTAVTFTISPEQAGVTPIAPQTSLSVNVPGDNLSVASARQYCQISISRL